MYGNQYMYNPYNPQNNLDRINAQIADLEKVRQQLSQQPVQQPITQNFQISPVNHDVIRYADSIDDVRRNVVIGETPYFSKDMSVVWIKNIKGEITTYELCEIIPKDDKDIQIELMQSEIENLRRELHEQSYKNVNEPANTTSSSTSDEYVRTEVKNDKSSSVQNISTSKKR